MPIKKRSITTMLAVTVMAATILGNLQRASAQEESVLFSFKKRTAIGNDPRAGLIFDSAGNLYGTTSQGGTGGAGTVFELSPRAGGGWNAAVLYSFSPKPRYTISEVSGVVFDKAGNLYGTTYLGGSENVGRVFELVRQVDGSFTETVLHNFQKNGIDGYGPLGGVTLDSSGNVYGTTVYGGNGSCEIDACGTAFELTPAGGGTWTESTIHSFGSATDPGAPEALTFYKGNIYGATAGGGTETGNVFELSPASGGAWNETILASFTYGNDGQNPNSPNGNLVFDASGNIYGLSQGGSDLSGTVFEPTPGQDGTWDMTILYNFNGNSTGGDPFGGLILDSLGNLYGVTQGGGAYNAGTVFEVKP